MKRSLVAAVAIALSALVAACSGPILANPPASLGPGPAPTLAPSALPDPQPIAFPRDDGAHHRLTEWWYYTGHLVDGSGRRYGFEFVIFRAERGPVAVSWASHLAVTDESAGAFHYAQRAEIGPQVDATETISSGPTSFALAIVGLSPGIASAVPGASAGSSSAAAPGAPATPWVMRGYQGQDHLLATTTPAESAAAGSPGGLGFDLQLQATKPPVLHGQDGWLDFGLAGGSYYYSRTAMTAAGTLEVDGRQVAVTGSAWFDHQWGDFIAVGGGGWDWFAVNLADGTDLTLSLVRATDGSLPLVYGTVVDAQGRGRRLDRTEFTVRSTGTWTSPLTGATYPAGWRVEVPGLGLAIDLQPAVAGQELDTRATTGVIYWEGSQVVRATRNGVPLSGEAYVELTGYASAR